MQLVHETWFWWVAAAPPAPPLTTPLDGQKIKNINVTHPVSIYKQLIKDEIEVSVRSPFFLEIELCPYYILFICVNMERSPTNHITVVPNWSIPLRVTGCGFVNRTVFSGQYCRGVETWKQSKI